MDYLNEKFWSGIATIPQDSSIDVVIEEGDVEVNVRNQTENLSGIKVYLFNSLGAYLGRNATTDSNGLAYFVLPTGMSVKFRADNLGYKFWCDPVEVVVFTPVDLFISYQNVTITINEVYDTSSDPLQGVKVYLFTASGSYMGQNLTTDSAGQVTFYLPERAYKVRADYQSKQYWSAEFTAQNVSVEIPHADALITVTGNGLPLANVPVYVFTQSGTYLGINDVTNGNGQVTFRLSTDDPASVYKFRADYQSNQYWSVESALTAHQVNPVDISTGGGAFELTVEKGGGAALENISCYVFSESGEYLGLTSATEIDGTVVFNLADGRYKFRADYMGYQYWTDVYEVPSTLSATLPIAHTDVTVSVQGVFDGVSDPIAGAGVYVFTPDDTYMGLTQTTNVNGQVVFNLPDQLYKVRTDYLTRSYWSTDFLAVDITVDIPMADADVWVSWNGQPLEDIPVYVFNDTDTYLGINDSTDYQGATTFRLPAETYKFRADYLSNSYWSGEQPLLSDQSNPVDIFTDGGTFNLTILKDQTNPLAGDKTYLFNQYGNYLNMFNTTDEYGQVSYDLPEGSFQFRIDTLGYQFWTDLYIVPDTLSEVVTIDHQDVTVTLQALDPEPSPLEGVSVYLFKPAGEYMGMNLTTDSSGQVIFNLPDRQYKVRADFLGQQFWSNAFQWQDTTVAINRGTVDLQVQLEGVNIVGATVYLFSESGAYLGISEVTDENGVASFLLPDRPYKFRIDYEGSQYWSDEITATAGTASPVVVDLAPPTVSISADPVSIEVGQSSTLTWSSTYAYSCIIEPFVGEVQVSGSIDVYPTGTTTYTITATGAGGIVTDTVDVFVGSALPNDIELGFAFDEQQGGGGLVGDTVRLINGNVIESRSDLNFASPNSFGLAFNAIYNSQSNIPGALGYGWSHTYALTLNPSFEMFGQTYIKIVDETGRAAYFLEDTPGLYQGAFKEKSYVSEASGEYVWHRLDGTIFGFDSSGNLIWIDDQKGNRLNLSYDVDGKLATIADTASGRVLTFNYNADNLLSSITGPSSAAVADGIWVEFGYDVNQNLTSVTYADNSGFDYKYEDPNDIHNLTEKKNKAGHLLNTWGYDNQDRCVGNFSKDGKGVDVIVYTSDTQVDVTDAYGTIRTYAIGNYDGRKRLTAMQGTTLPPYTSNNVVRWEYDGNLNLTEVEYGGGTINQYQDFDGGGQPGNCHLGCGNLSRAHDSIHIPP